MGGKAMKRSNSLSALIFSVLLGLFLLPMAPLNTDAAEDINPTHSQRLKIARPMAGWIASKFDENLYQKERLPRELRSGLVNPNMQRPQNQRHSFHLSIDKNRPPGIEYYTGGAPVRAVAAGIVHFVGQAKPKANSPGGNYVRVAHDLYDGLQKEFYPRIPLYRYQAYRSTYYHLSRVEVKHWQSVKRGQIIGYGMKYGPDSREKAKLVLEERGNWVNPDDYGLNHRFMDYWDGVMTYEVELEEMNTRLDRQADLVIRLNSFYTDKDKDNVFKKIHTVIDTEKFTNFPVEWSTIDRFRYLVDRYTKNPDLFPTLSAADFETIKKAFYNSQPIVLTLPF
jgi:hypothetical protein